MPGLNGAFALGRINLLRPGRDVALIALGPEAHTALAAAELLAREQSTRPSPLSRRSTPRRTDDLTDALARVPLAVTIEGHYRNGGLGSYVSELVAEAGWARASYDSESRRCRMR